MNTLSQALLAAAENVVKYQNFYDQWIVTSTIEACIQRQYPGFDYNPSRLPSSMAWAVTACDDFTVVNNKGIYRLNDNSDEASKIRGDAPPGFPRQ